MTKTPPAETYTDPPLIEQLLYARELFYYASHYRNQPIGIVITGIKQLFSIVDDLTVLQEAGIPLLIIAPHRSGLERRLSALNSLGYPLEYLPLFSEDLQEFSPLGAQLMTLASPKVNVAFYEEALGVFSRANFQKIIILTDTKGLEVNGVFQPHPSLSTLAERKPEEISISKELLELSMKVAKSSSREVVLVQAKAGEIFQEIFTHRGSGTMLAEVHLDEIRNAQKSDVRNIFFLLHPYLRNDSMRSITPNEILRDIHEFLVYTINDQLIASLKLDDYGEACEIAKLSALPRYQNRGRAAKLVEFALEECRKRKKTYAFALTTQHSVGEFFMRQGFTPLDRQLLPEAWKKQYDFARSSFAYSFRF